MFTSGVKKTTKWRPRTITGEDLEKAWGPYSTWGGEEHLHAIMDLEEASGRTLPDQAAQKIPKPKSAKDFVAAFHKHSVKI